MNLTTFIRDVHENRFSKKIFFPQSRYFPKDKIAKHPLRTLPFAKNSNCLRKFVRNSDRNNLKLDFCTNLHFHASPKVSNFVKILLNDPFLHVSNQITKEFFRKQKLKANLFRHQCVQKSVKIICSIMYKHFTLIIFNFLFILRLKLIEKISSCEK